MLQPGNYLLPRDTKRAQIGMGQISCLQEPAENTDAVLYLINHGLHLYPKADKPWMMKNWIYEDKDRLPSIQVTYNPGTKAYTTSIPLWLLLPWLEKNAGILFRARLAALKSGNSGMRSARTLRPRPLWTKPYKNAHTPASSMQSRSGTSNTARIEKVSNNSMLYVTVVRNF
ncbi:hypothetical protein HOY82DRAFT_548737 [Tuber indicum]|nr:hypothetical protein HOY82DRAFT_548737 [Tuber indicum]